MKNQITCDKCGITEPHWNDLPKGWAIVDDKDLCPKCYKLYDKTWRNKKTKEESKFQIEIDRLCKLRDKAGKYVFDKFLNTRI